MSRLFIHQTGETSEINWMDHKGQTNPTFIGNPLLLLT